MVIALHVWKHEVPKIENEVLKLALSLYYMVVRFELEPCVWTVVAAIHRDKNNIGAVEAGTY